MQSESEPEPQRVEIQITAEQWNKHLAFNQYDRFVLTEAIRPSFDLKVIPQANYVIREYEDEHVNRTVPVLLAAVSREYLFDVFLEFVSVLGDEVGLVLEGSHDRKDANHNDFVRYSIDTPVLKSMLWDYENILMHDGCAGIAIMDFEQEIEVQLDEHKLVSAFAADLCPFETIAQRYGLRNDPKLRLLTDEEHVHISSKDYKQQFEEMCEAFEARRDV